MQHAFMFIFIAPWTAIELKRTGSKTGIFKIFKTVTDTGTLIHKK